MKYITFQSYWDISFILVLLSSAHSPLIPRLSHHLGEGKIVEMNH